MPVSKRVKAVIVASAAAAIVSTPLYWLLGGPDSGQLAAASVQGATGVIALAWSLLTARAPSEPEPAPRATDAVDVASDTGKSSARDGGRAISGVLRESRADGRPARVERSGDAIAEGPGSVACLGVHCR
ncbi:hypothetical protein ACFV94_11925 [Streptomyces sp. NPDC059896]|uniref:hypothetical protein n=1 Tax=Streptomyces sp. NPDC059896 TaxID=3346993 RepID=UPI00365CDA71